MATLVNRVYNPVSGYFGSGNVMVYAGQTAAIGAQTATTYTWTVPSGVDAVRVRLWGGGGYNGGGGGGFALKAIYGLSGTTSVLISVGFGGNATTTTGGTSSFGAFVSATGGAGSGGAGGTGSGGDVNTSGGNGTTSSFGGGSGSIYGNGGYSSSGGNNDPISGFGGGGAGAGVNDQNSSGAGFLGSAAIQTNNTTAPLNSRVITAMPGSGLEKFSIDFLGTGAGGIQNCNGINGGGGGAGSMAQAISGGIPGGGGGATTFGGYGLVIVEW